MSLFHALRARLRAAIRPAAANESLSDEIRFHIDLETEKNVKLGMSPEEARRHALAHFGGVQRVREEHRDVRPLRWLEDAAADSRFALRALRRTPALGLAAIVTLAFGIGANVAIFSAVNAVLLNDLPFPAPDRLMVITEENPEKHWHLNTASPANLLDWRAGVTDFQDVTGYVDGLGRATLTGRGDPRLVASSYVMGNFFSTLGARAALGRTLTDDETWRGGMRPLVLSDRGWREHFGADPGIVGKSATLDGHTYQIVGVMPPGFAYPRENVDCWESISWDKTKTGEVNFRRAHYIRAVARLKPGATQAHADAQLQTVVERLKRDYPATNRVMGAAMMPLQDYLNRDTRLPLLVLLTSVAFLLLIACANVGNLLLVQAAGRTREAALRLALGAGRARLTRQALTESLVLSVIGGLGGLALGWAGTRALVRLQPAGMLRLHDFGLDARVVAYAVAITIVSALLFGVAPALWTRHRTPADALKSGGRGMAASGRSNHWGDALVVSEVALALLMAVGAGLLTRTFFRVRAVDAGFDPHGVLSASLQLNARYDSAAKIHAFVSELETRLRAVPGVTAAAVSSNIPFRGTSYTTDYIAYGRPEGGYGTEIGNRTVTPSYFATMRVPVLRGRVFNAEDRIGSPPVLVINETLANSYFKGEDPVGQRITFGKVITPKSTWYTIIGVVGSEHVDGLDRPPRIEAYHPEAQEPPDYMVMLLRTDGDPVALAPTVRRVVSDLDPTLAIADVISMESLRDLSLARTRFLTLLLLSFAVIGLALSVVGVYGVLAQAARNRVREMGIRIALGAQAAQVRWIVVRRGLRLTAIGLVVGAMTALYATQAMTKLLFRVSPTDPATLIGVTVILTATSVVASWIPALRASRADPAQTLRAD